MSRNRAEIEAWKKARATEALGMNPATAAHRLKRAVVFWMLQELNIVCYRCGGPLEEEDYSYDHIVEWRGAENAKELYFDTSNVTISHKGCNSLHSRHNHPGKSVWEKTK